jgi:hypothetical protein
LRRILWTALAAVLSFPIGTIFVFLLTPVLWKLEPVLHVELAGHSGPSDWILWTASFTASLVGGIAANRLTRQKTLPSAL